MNKITILGYALSFTSHNPLIILLFHILTRWRAIKFNEHRGKKELKRLAQSTRNFQSPKEFHRIMTRVTSGRFPAGFHEMFRSLTSTRGVSPVTIRLDEYLYGRRMPR